MLAGYVKVMLNLALMFSLYYPVFVFPILSTLTSAGNRTRAQKPPAKGRCFPDALFLETDFSIRQFITNDLNPLFGAENYKLLFAHFLYQLRWSTNGELHPQSLNLALTQLQDSLL
jgi:hypothetical protein